MDQSVDTTQKIVIYIAILIGILILLIIGYSLYNRANIAEGELANKEALESQTKSGNEQASISLTGQGNSNSFFNFDSLLERSNNTNIGTTSNQNIELVNENIPVEVPKEEKIEEVPKEEVVVIKKPTKPVVYVDEDRPLTAEEILRIRQLPVEESPSGGLQYQLEKESGGQYRAQY